VVEERGWRRPSIVAVGVDRRVCPRRPPNLTHYGGGYSILRDNVQPMRLRRAMKGTMQFEREAWKPSHEYTTDRAVADAAGWGRLR